MNIFDSVLAATEEQNRINSVPSPGTPAPIVSGSVELAEDSETDTPAYSQMSESQIADRQIQALATQIDAIQENLELDNDIFTRKEHFGLTSARLKTDLVDPMGNPISVNPSVDMWLQASNLNWDVRQSPVNYETVIDDITTMVKSESDKVLYRSDNGFQLGIVGNGYKPVQNNEIVGFFSDYCQELGATIDQVGYADNGKKVYCYATLEKEVKLVGQEIGSKRILLVDSRDGSSAFRAIPFYERMYCFNQLQGAMAKFGKISRKHTCNLDLRVVAKDLGIIQQGFDDLIPMLTRFMNTGMSKTEALAFIYKVHAKKETVDQESTRNLNIVKSIWDKLNGRGIALDAPECNGTAYGALNAITEHYNHDSSNNANNLWKSKSIGAGAQIMTDAYNCLDQIIAGEDTLNTGNEIIEHILERATV